MLPTQVFGNLFRREFGFANIAEVSGKVNGFSCKKKSSTQGMEAESHELRMEMCELVFFLRVYDSTFRFDIIIDDFY